MSPTHLDLSSVNAKLKWAVAHFEAVDAEIAAWIKGNEYGLVPHRNAEFTEFWLVANMPGTIPDFERWSLMLGDCFTNLRDTLDHAVYAIANLPSSPRPDKRDKACFLCTSCEKDFRDWSKTKLASVPDGVRSAMLSFQPYNRPPLELPPLLSILSELANRNKHKLINVVMAIPALGRAHFESPDSKNKTAKVYLGREEIVHGARVFTLQFENPEPALELKHSDSRLCVAVKHEPMDGDTAWGADRTPHDVLFALLLREVATILDGLNAAI